MVTDERPDSVIERMSDLTGRIGARIVHLPDTATSLVLRTTPAGRTELLVVGPRTTASYHTGKALPSCLKLRLRPGIARSALGVSVGALVDRVTPLADLWGAPGARLERRLADIGDDHALIRGQVEACLRSRVAVQRPRELARARLVGSATRALADRGSAHLAELTRRLSVSERHLREVLTDGAGLPPARFARITRLRRAMRCGRVETGRLAQLAVRTGYFDQSHMTAEFTTLLGVSPGAFFAGRLPAPQPC